MSGLHRDINVHCNYPTSRRVQKPQERAEGRAGLRARPALPPWAPTLAQQPIRLRLEDYAPPPLRIKENRAIKVGLIRRPTFIWKGYISWTPGPWRRHPFIPIHYS